MQNRKIIAALIILIVLGPFTKASQRLPERDWTQSATAHAIPNRDISTADDGIAVLEAWRIDSPHFGFGGWSALAMRGNRDFLAASDTGWTMRFALGEAGRIDGLAIARLPRDAVRSRDKRGHDLEAIERAPNGDIMASFEGRGVVRRYDRDMRRALSSARPQAMRQWPSNGGGETLVSLGDGRWMVIAERAVMRGGKNAVLIFDGDPSVEGTPVSEWRYDAEGKGSVTDGAMLPDGRIVLLHRRFALPFEFTTTIAIAEPFEGTPDEAWTSRSLATFDTDPLSENYEGLAVDPDAACTCVWMISDDNLSNWQSTMLVKLRLPARDKSKAESQATKKRR